MNTPELNLLSITKESNFQSCCTNFYENDVVKFLLGDSFHPGGLDLTLELVKTFKLSAGENIIDIACGLGTSLIEIINRFEVVGIGLDLSFTNLQIALERAKKKRVETQLTLIQADTHTLPFRSGSTKSIMSECSFCIFIDKNTVASEINRLLEYGGIFGFTDVTKIKDWPHNLSDMFLRIVCIADAKSPEEYAMVLEEQGFSIIESVDRKDVVYDLHSSLKKKMLMLNIAWGINKLRHSTFQISRDDFKKINKTIDLIKEFAEYKYGSYVLMVAEKV